MRVVQFIGSKKLGGAENFFVRLQNALSRLSNPPVSLVADGSQLIPELDTFAETVPIYSVWDPITKLSVKEKLRYLEPDVVQTWMGRATRLTAGNKSFVHVARLGGYYNLRHYRHCDHWIGNTKGICDYLVSNGFPADRVLHISNFVEPQVFDRSVSRQTLTQELGVDGSKRIIVAAGRLHPNKGFDTLIRAYARSRAESKKLRDTHLVIAGSGSLESELKTLSSELEVSGSITWLGWRSDVEFLLSAADLFVCPSRHEPLGNVILEAWAQRTPVISTATDGAVELCQESKAARLTPVEDYRALAKALTEWGGDHSSVYSEMAELGAAELRARYSSSVILKQYQDFYSSLKAC